MPPRRYRPPDDLDALRHSDKPDFELLERLPDETLLEIVADEGFGFACFDAIGVLRVRGVDPFARGDRR